jgi:predicted nucleic acid-binding protein
MTIRTTGKGLAQMIASLDAFAGTHIYVDTMLLYTLLRAEERVRPVIQRFFSRIESGEILAYTSVLSFDELAYRLILALVRDKYAGSPLDHLRSRETEILKEMAPAVIPKLQALRAFPNLLVTEITPQDTDGMLQNMLDYPLKPRDALHLATMKRLCCFDLASNDHRFDEIVEVRRFSIS